mgnify:FL=1
MRLIREMAGSSILRRVRRDASFFLATLLLVPAVPTVLFAQDVDNGALQALAQRISEKRAELEELSDELDLTKTEFNERLRSLSTQTADVEALINREELQLAQVEDDIAEVQREIDRARSGSLDVSPVVDELTERVRAYIEAGIPFQRSQRLETVATIERLRADGSLGDQTALTRLWNIVDSEFRLVGDSGLYRQTISLQGEEKLAEVARLGMVLLYFRTLDGQVGTAIPVDGSYRYETVTDPDSRRQIEELFDALQRNLRQGFFTVPNPYRQEN